MDSKHSYRKGQPVWWKCADAKNRPTWMSKGRTEQACEIKDVDFELEQAAIVLLNDDRKTECYIVPLDSIRPRTFS
jgi:hypothetical protein